MAYARGIDVSHYQGVIDWGKVAAGWEFAVARMTIGRSTLDDCGAANLEGMGATSIVAGAYGVVGTAEPVEDGAELLVRQIRAAGADPANILVMLDAEDFSDGSHPTIGQVDRYAGRLRALIGRWPVAYVPLWWLGSHAYTVDGLGLANCPWAQSRYYDPAYWSDSALLARKPSLTHGWKRLAWLQYTSSASTTGISGDVDANIFYGTITQLRADLLGAHATEDLDMTIDELRKELSTPGTPSRLALWDLLCRSVNATAGGTDSSTIGPASPAHQAITALATALQTVNAKLDAGLQVGLTPEQVADIKAALPTLEGSAMVSLAVSPPA